jgi:ATP-binding cassette subfamily F protein uup
MEARIHEAEAVTEQKQALLHDPSVTTDPVRLRTAYEELQAAQAVVDALYARWAELEAKLA